MRMNKINGVMLDRPLVVLCDSGSTHSLIKRTSLPFVYTPMLREHSVTSTTAQGTYTSRAFIYMDNIRFPEYINSRRIQGLNANVFNSPTCPYHIILGRDFSQQIGLKIYFLIDPIQWFNTILPMKNISEFRNSWNNTFFDYIIPRS